MYISDVNLKSALATYAHFWDDNQTGLHDNNDAISISASIVSKLLNISEYDLNQHMIRVITNQQVPKPEWGEALFKSIKSRHPNVGKKRRIRG